MNSIRIFPILLFVLMATPYKAFAWQPCMPFCYCDTPSVVKMHTDFMADELKNMASSSKSIPHRVRAIANTAQATGNIAARIATDTAELTQLRLATEAVNTHTSLDAVANSITAELIVLQEMKRSFTQNYLRELATLARSFVISLEAVNADEMFGAMGLPLEADSLLFYGLQEQNTPELLASRAQALTDDFMSRAREVRTISVANEAAATEIMSQMIAGGTETGLSHMLRGMTARKSFELPDTNKPSEQLDAILLDYNLRINGSSGDTLARIPHQAGWTASEMMLRNQMARRIREISYNEAAYLHCREVITSLRGEPIEPDALVSSRELDYGTLNKNQSPCWFRNVRMLNQVGVTSQLVLNQTVRNRVLYQEYRDLREQNILLAIWAAKEIKSER